MWEEVVCTFTVSLPLLKDGVQTQGEREVEVILGSPRGKTNGWRYRRRWFWFSKKTATISPIVGRGVCPRGM